MERYTKKVHDNQWTYQNGMTPKSKLRALISNNFGRRKNDPVKDRKALATYVELKGYKHGEMEVIENQKVKMTS